MKTKIFATVVIMLCATGCATTAARRQFDDITLPAGMAYQPQDSVVIESPTIKAAQLVYRGRLEPVTLGEAMRTRLEASGWRQVSRTSTSTDGTRQVYEKEGNVLGVHIYEGLWYTYLAISASQTLPPPAVQTGSDTPPASLATGVEEPKAAGAAVLSGLIRLVTRRMAAISGVSVGDTVPPRLRSRGVSIVTREASGPSASLIIASTSCCSTPGSERISTSMSTRSGMTFTLVPPWAMLGENVVCVQAWASRARARLSRSHTAS